MLSLGGCYYHPRGSKFLCQDFVIACLWGQVLFVSVAPRLIISGMSYHSHWAGCCLVQKMATCAKDEVA